MGVEREGTRGLGIGVSKRSGTPSTAGEGERGQSLSLEGGAQTSASPPQSTLPGSAGLAVLWAEGGGPLAKKEVGLIPDPAAYQPESRPRFDS